MKENIQTKLVFETYDIRYSFEKRVEFCGTKTRSNMSKIKRVPDDGQKRHVTPGMPGLSRLGTLFIQVVTTIGSVTNL